MDTLSADFQKALDLREELANTSTPSTDVNYQVSFGKIIYYHRF